MDEVKTLDMGEAAEFIQSKEKKRGRPPQAPKIEGDFESVPPSARAAIDKQVNKQLTTAQRKEATAAAFEAAVTAYGDPIAELAKIGFDTREKAEVRVAALKEFASYGHGKIKSVEHTGADGAPLEFKMSLVQNILNMILPEPTVEPHLIEKDVTPK